MKTGLLKINLFFMWFIFKINIFMWIYDDQAFLNKIIKKEII
jgi:hypothetical protein